MAPLHPTGLTGKKAVGITGPHSPLYYHIDMKQPPDQHSRLNTDVRKKKVPYDVFGNFMRLSWSPMMDSSSSPVVHTTGAHCLKIMNADIVGLMSRTGEQ